MAKTSIRGPYVDEYFALEPLDRALLRGLQLAPRGQFRAFADVLGVSEQTVARRYRQMRDRGVVRVTTVVNLEALGETTWLVRAACKPPSARQLAAALARREDARWIFIASGGAEVICKIRSRTASDYNQLLLARLSGNDSVAAVSTAMILNQFAGGLSASPWDLGDALDDDQLCRLTDLNETSPLDSRSSPADTKSPVLDSADWALLRQLELDGRTSFARLAEVSGLAQGTAGRRLHSLLNLGVAAVDVDIAPSALGRPILAQLWMAASPASLEACGKALATLPDVAFAAAVSGPHNLVASVACRSLPDLYRFIADDLARIDGLTAIEVVPIITTVKQSTTPVDQGMLVEMLSPPRPQTRRTTPPTKG